MTPGRVKAEDKQELRRYVAPLVVAWVVLLAAGIVYFSVLGLAGR